MKIAVLTSGILPVPAVQGGAVENLVDFYLDYNNYYRLHDITVYSIWDPRVKHHLALKSEVNHYVYFQTKGIIATIYKHLYHFIYKDNEYYHHSIEYYFRRSLKQIQKQKYDAIIIENRPGFVLLLKEFTDAKIIIHLHNEQLDKNTNCGNKIYKGSSLIITVSDYIKNRINSICKDNLKCKTVHNGINLDAFSKRKTNKRNILFKEEDFVVVFSGRLAEEKGIMELIKAICLLKDYPQIKLLIIGSSFYGNNVRDNEFVQSLKEEAKKIHNRIVFTGFVPYSEIPSYLGIADVAAIPSVWDDPFPTTVLEAQAMGLPIITTRRGGIPEEVTDDNAILLNTDEQFINTLSNSILDLYHNPQKRKRMAEYSTIRAKLFDKNKYSETFFKTIDKLFE